MIKSSMPRLDDVATAREPVESAPGRLREVPSPAIVERRRRRSIVPLWVPLTLLVVGGGGYLLSGAWGAESGDVLRLTGVVVANEVIVAANVPGRIRELAVREGATVTQGQLIVRLDRDELDAERRNHVALIDQLSARLRHAREVTTLETDRARGATAAARAALEAARSQRDEGEASLRQLQNDIARVRRLFDAGLLSRQTLEQQETDVRIAESRLKALAGQVVRAEADLDLALANERQVVLAQHDVTETEAQLRQADAQLAQTAARMAYTEVLSPLAGTVSLRVAREGEVVKAGDPIVTIVDLDDVWVSAAVEETYISRVARGDTVGVELISGERMQGTVSFVSPEAEFATQRDVSRSIRDIRTFGIRVTVPNADRRLHAGMTAYVTLPAPAASSSSSPAAAGR